MNEKEFNSLNKRISEVEEEAADMILENIDSIEKLAIDLSEKVEDYKKRYDLQIERLHT